ncbi:MAG: DUF2844 domain-containing protein [Burkholderiaceae bacterium]
MKVHARDTRLRAARVAALGFALTTSAATAIAALGGNVGSVEADRLQMRAVRQAASPGITGSVQEMRLPDGSTIRQFVNARGIVYAVAWSARVKPDFTQLLGRHAASFDAGAAAAARQPGLKRSITVDQGDLVVVSSGRPGAFVGRAWLKSELPAGAATDAIR